MKINKFRKTGLVLSSCCALLLASLTVKAQEDEPFYKDYIRRHPQINGVSVSKSKSATKLSVAKNGPCDLVSNGDFEGQLVVPTRINNIGGGFVNDPTPGNEQIASQLVDWKSPTAGTPDYYASNSQNAQVVPATAIYAGANGFRPFSGIGSIGLYTRQQYSSYDRVAEYVSSKLPSQLEAGKRYYAHFFVNLSENKNVCNRSVASGFGFQVSNGELAGFPNYNTRNFITTATGRGVLNTLPIDGTYLNYWRRVSGQFTANTGDNTITLGYFNSNSSAYASVLPGGSSTAVNTYLFVDNVEIFRIPTAGGAKSVVCGTAVTLGEGCAIPGATYAWRKAGQTTVLASTLVANFNPTANTTYQLTVTLPDGSTHVTSATVTTTALTTPQISEISKDPCSKIVNYRIVNYNSSFKYNISGMTAGLTALQSNPLSANFSVQGTGGLAGNSTGGSFVVNATNACGTTTTNVSTVFDTVRTPNQPYVVPSGRPVACYDMSQYFNIVDFNPLYTYDIQGSGINAIPGKVGYGTNFPNQAEFRMKGGAGVTGGFFTVTATFCGLTSPVQAPGEEFEAVFPTCSLLLNSSNVYPNPASKEIRFPVSDKIVLMNTNGKIVMNINDGQINKLDVSKLPNGLYLMKLWNKKIMTSKMIRIEK